jgi:predicted glycosyltransferase
VFDTDNGRSAGVHFWSAAPFATMITTPDCLPSDLGRKQLKYPSYKSLAFLHPDRFTPDHTVRSRLGVSPDEPYFLIRLVSMAASHDTGERGLDLDQVTRIIETLEARGRVFLSSEFDLPSTLSDYKLNTAVSDFHHVVASASLCVGDSGSVVQESALMGVPSVFISSFAGRTAPIEELEHRYGLIRSFHPNDFRRALEVIHRLRDEDWMEFRARHLAMLDDKVDLTEWYLALLHRLVSDTRRPSRRGARS